MEGRAAAAIAGMNEQISFPEIERVIICDNKARLERQFVKFEKGF